jgi:hypothetical protein
MNSTNTYSTIGESGTPECRLSIMLLSAVISTGFHQQIFNYSYDQSLT